MIYIDASRYNNTKKRTGVENYSFFIINELIKLAPQDITLISPKKIPLDVKQIIIPFPRLWTQIRLSWEILKNRKIDNLFVPSHMLPLIHPKDSVLTIHDVAWKHTPESYSRKSKCYLEWGTRFAVKNAKKIITVSETTKKDLIQFYKADPEKIHVAPLGITAPKVGANKNEELKILDKWSLSTGNYFLYLGRIENKKGTDILIKAFHELKNRPQIKLVVAGGIGHGGAKILKQIPAEMRSRIIATGYINEKEKDALLKNAFCFVLPSRYEGFGLPLLEAMQYNLPIIASDIPTSREIAEKNALFFKSSDPKELKEKMEILLKDKKIRESIIKNHINTLKQYTWEKCANIIFKLINS